MKVSTAAASSDGTKARSLFRMTIRLNGVMPIVWRTILVRPETKLSNLHRYLQAAMGWQDYHPFCFTIDGKPYTIPNRNWDLKLKIYDARRYTLARLFPAIPARFSYFYDFGDRWEHVVDIESIETAVPRKQYPICVAGAEPCPPEDCGGPPGYRELRLILKNPDDVNFAEYTSWAASQYYPTEFSTRLANALMRLV